MSLSKLLLKVSAPSKLRSSKMQRKRSGARPTCESLENRVLLASNILIDPNNGLTSSSLLTYTPAGNLVSSSAIVYPFTQSPEAARGMAVDPQGNLQVFNGSAHPYLSTLAPGGATLQDHQFAGLNQNLPTTPYYGSIATYGNFVYAPSNSTQFGIVRFDTNNYSAQGFAPGVPYGILTVGLDGLLYALNSTTSTTSADIFDPLTVARLGSIPLSVSTTYSGIAVDATGNIFASDLTGHIYEYNKSGVLEKTLATGVTGFASLILANDGTLVGSALPHKVVVSDTSISSFSTFAINNNSGTFFTAFASSPTENSGLPITLASSPIDAGTATTFTVTAPGPGFLGKVHFTSSDSQAVLPADYTFLAADHGTHVFAATLKTAGMQTIAARWTADNTVSGNVMVKVTPLTAAAFVISGFTPHVPEGVSETFTVTAVDKFGNIAPNYTGKVHFTSSDLKAALPLDYTFTTTDKGVHGFSATFNSARSQSLLLQDVINSSILGADDSVPVTFNIPTIDGILITGNDKLYEYSPQGVLLKTVKVTDPNTDPNGYDPPTGEYVRGVGVDWLGAIDVFNGTFQPVFSEFDGTIWYLPFLGVPDGWSIKNDIFNGSIAHFGPFAFVPDEAADGETTNGIIRINEANGSVDRMAQGIDYNKLAIGQNNRLYALRDDGLGTHLDEFEPRAGSFIRTINLSVKDVYTGIGATASGDIYMAAQSGYIYHFDSQGNLINEISTNCGLTDMALAADGTIIAIGNDRVSITDERLTSVYVFPSVPAQFGINFIGFSNYQSNVYGLQLTAPTVAGQGTPITVTVTATSSDSGNLFHFTSSDPAAILPAPYALTQADLGTHTFTVTLFTPGDQVVTLVEENGDSTSPVLIHVGPPLAGQLDVAGYPDSIAGQSQEFTVSAIDANGDVDPSYTGAVTFNSSDPLAELPDNYTFTASDQGTHTFTATFITAGSQTLTATDVVSTSIAGAEQGISISPAAASHLAFQVQPSLVDAGNAINPAVVVELLDPFGNLVTNDNSDQVNLSLASGSGSFTSGSTTSATASGGVATFGNLVLNVSGFHTLASSAAGLTGSTSSGFFVNPGPASLLTFTTQPSSGTAGVVMSPAVKVSVFDQFGNLLGDDNVDLATLSVASGPGGFSAGSTKTVAMRQGVATFSNLSFDAAGTYVLAVNGLNGLTGPNSTSFVIHPGPVSLSQSTISIAPATIQSGSIATVTLTAKDARGNQLSSGGLTALFALGAGGSQAILGDVTDKGDGTYTATLTATTPGTARTITATIGGQAVTSTLPTFVVTPGPATKLVVTARASNPLVADTPFNLTISAFDAQGNLATSYTGAITFSSTDGSAVLPANYTFTAADQGVHTFFPTMEKSGVQSVTAKDVSNSALATTANLLIVVVSKIVPVNPVPVIYGPNPLANQNEAFIKGLYRLILGRNADAGGLTFWMNYMSGNGTTPQVRAQVVQQGFWNSRENRTREVNGYYETYLGRPADAQGLNFWIAQLQGGEDETAVVAFFLLQQEAAKLGNNQWVSNLYEGALGRAPEPSGFAYWTGQLNSGQASRTQIEQSFVLGSEAAGAAVDSFYIDYLQRVPDAGGRAFYVQAISSGGTTYASVAQLLLASDEFFTNAAKSLQG